LDLTIIKSIFANVIDKFRLRWKHLLDFSTKACFICLARNILFAQRRKTNRSFALNSPRTLRCGSSTEAYYQYINSLHYTSTALRDYICTP